MCVLFNSAKTCSSSPTDKQESASIRGEEVINCDFGDNMDTVDRFMDMDELDSSLVFLTLCFGGVGLRFGGEGVRSER